MAMLKSTSVSKRLKKEAARARGSAFLQVMRHAFGHGEKLFEYLEEPFLSYTCSLFRTNLMSLIITREGEIAAKHQKHYELAVLACGMWDNRPHARPFFSIVLQPALYDMIYMYNANISLQMIRGTNAKAIEIEFVPEWAHVHVFFKYLFEKMEEVTEDALWSEVIGETYFDDIKLDLSVARHFLIKHKPFLVAEHARIQQKHAANQAIDLTADEE
jgi:hypothetical protein